MKVRLRGGGGHAFCPTPIFTSGRPNSSLVDPTLTEDYSPPELKLEPRSPDIVLNENIDINDDIPYVPDDLPRPRAKRV